MDYSGRGVVGQVLSIPFQRHNLCADWISGFEYIEPNIRSSNEKYALLKKKNLYGRCLKDYWNRIVTMLGGCISQKKGLALSVTTLSYHAFGRYCRFYALFSGRLLQKSLMRNG